MHTSSSKLKNNTQILLASRPQGKPVKENFTIIEAPIPELKTGEVLLQTIYLSLDPYMRGRMNAGESYAPPVKINEVMVGATVSQVVKSLNSDFLEGDWVLAQTGWQAYAVSNGNGLIKLGNKPDNPSYALGILGMPGFTAYVGLLKIGELKPEDTVVVAAASGAVGSVVGQIAKLKGCKVIGIAGGKQKCDYVINTLGFDDCIDHKDENFTEQLKKACKQGIDVYFESVGGKVFDAVLPLLNKFARVPLCGLISQYNKSSSSHESTNKLSLLPVTTLIKSLKIQGFIIFDYYKKYYAEFTKQMNNWLQENKIHYREHRIHGLDNAPEAFIGLLEGQNFGKLLVEI